MEIIQVKISELRHAEYNPRKISDQDFCQIESSLKTFGFVEPLVVNKAPGREGVIIGGNQRFEVAKKMGLTDVPVHYVEISDLAKEKELNVRLNRNVGEWDWDILEKEFGANSLLDYGFRDEEISYFDEKKNVKEEMEDAPDVPLNPRSKNGCLYILGNHRLFCGDSTVETDVKFLMNEKKARLVFTDPPYSVDYQSTAGNSYSKGKYGGDGKIFNDDKDAEEARVFYGKVLGNLYKFSTDDASLYWWFANKMNWVNRLAWIETDWYMAQIVVWLKEQMIFSIGQDYHRCYEPCMFGWKKGNAHFTNKRISNAVDCIYLGKEEFADLPDVWYQHRDKINEYVHPTQKPVKLCHRALKKNSVQGDIVLDLFGGSGSTLIACEQLNRLCYMMELDPKYCDVIIQRYCNFTGQDKEKIYETCQSILGVTTESSPS